MIKFKNVNCQILVGEIQSGKTSFISKWIRGKYVGGFLTPDKYGNRYFYDIKSKVYYPFEIETTSQNQSKIIQIGKYSFLKSTFLKGSEMILQSKNESYDFFIIDEFGTLEMKNEGFGLALNEIMEFIKSKKSNTIYVIILRLSLLQSFLSYFQLDNEETNVLKIK